MSSVAWHVCSLQWYQTLLLVLLLNWDIYRDISQPCYGLTVYCNVTGSWFPWRCCQSKNLFLGTASGRGRLRTRFWLFLPDWQLCCPIATFSAQAGGLEAAHPCRSECFRLCVRVPCNNGWNEAIQHRRLDRSSATRLTSGLLWSEKNYNINTSTITAS